MTVQEETRNSRNQLMVTHENWMDISQAAELAGVDRYRGYLIIRSADSFQRVEFIDEDHPDYEVRFELAALVSEAVQKVNEFKTAEQAKLAERERRKLVRQQRMQAWPEKQRIITEAQDKIGAARTELNVIKASKDSELREKRSELRENLNVASQNVSNEQYKLIDEKKKEADLQISGLRDLLKLEVEAIEEDAKVNMQHLNEQLEIDIDAAEEAINAEKAARIIELQNIIRDATKIVENRGILPEV